MSNENETPWDRFIREQEDRQVEFEEFHVYRYKYTEGPDTGKTAFDFYRTSDGMWHFESDPEDRSFATTDEFIEFMRPFNLQPPKASAATTESKGDK